MVLLCSVITKEGVTGMMNMIVNAERHVYGKLDQTSPTLPFSALTACLLWRYQSLKIARCHLTDEHGKFGPDQHETAAGVCSEN